MHSSKALRTRQDDDVDLGSAGIVPPLLPDGEYECAFLRVEEGRFLDDRARWFLWFAVLDGPYRGKEVYLSCPFPKTGKAFGLGSKLVAAVEVAIGRLPHRRERLTTACFREKYFLLKTRTVRHDQKGRERPKDDWYSVIEKLIRVTAGAQ